MEHPDTWLTERNSLNEFKRVSTVDCESDC